MTPEEQYDTEIAPSLRLLAGICREKGFSMTCIVEYAPGEWGETTTVSAQPSLGFTTIIKNFREWFTLHCTTNITHMEEGDDV